MNTRTQNMLMAARSLLETSGPELTSASDAFTVARKVLVAHDVAELVFAALCIEAGSKFKVSEGTSFFELVGAVRKEFCGQDTSDVRKERRVKLLSLNYARVRFKHYGDLLDAPSTYSLVEQALGVVDLLCEIAVGIPLRSIDALASITHNTMLDSLRIADSQIGVF